MLSSASATWEGGFHSGRGRVRLGSGLISREYSVASRVEGARGTSPEELLAAAFATGVAMTIAQWLDQRGTPAISLSTRATCVAGQTLRGFGVRQIQLDVTAAVSGITDEEFRLVASEATRVDPVSLVLPERVPIAVVAKLQPLRSRPLDTGIASRRTFAGHPARCVEGELPGQKET